MVLPSILRPVDRFTLRDRRITTLMALVAFIVAFGGSTMVHTVPFTRNSLDISEGTMSWLFAFARAVSLVGLLFAVYADRHGRRRPFLVAFLLLAVGNSLTAVLPGVALFAVAQAVTRVSVVAVGALAVVFLAEELSPRVRGYGLAVYSLAASMGTGLGLILLPIAEGSPEAWRILFGLSAIGFLAVPALARFLPESRAFEAGRGGHGTGHVLPKEMRRYFWPLATVAFFVAAFASPAFDFVLERLINDLEWDAGASRFLLIVFSGIGVGAGVLAGGRLADTIGRRPTSAAAIILGLVGGVSFYVFDSGWVLAPAILVASLGTAMFGPAFAAHRSELFPTRVRATAAAWISNVAILGSILGFAVGGLFVDSIGLSQTIALLGAGLIISLVVVMALPETRGIDLIGAPVDPAAASEPGSQPVQPSTPPSPTTPRVVPNPGEAPRAAPPPH
jgi:MFS family permease